MKWLVVVLAVSACSCAKAQDNNLPKYGSEPGYKTIWERTSESEKAFNIKDSKQVAQTGWTYLNSGDASTAIKRFNQAWTLYPKNYLAIWGMAVVVWQRARRADSQEAAAKQLDQAIALINEAKGLNGSDASLLTDTALFYAHRGDLRRKSKAEGSEQDFQEAESLLKTAEKIEQHPHILETWAALERCRGNQDAAKRYETMAAELADQLGLHRKKR